MNESSGDPGSADNRLWQPVTIRWFCIVCGASFGYAVIRYHVASQVPWALCSPTRAALLSGRNHHSAASGVIMELGTGFPGYNTLMPKSCGTFAEVLKQNGQNTVSHDSCHTHTT